MANLDTRLSTISMTAGMLTRGAVESALAELRAAGCTVTYADKTHGVFSTTWYNLEIVGPFNVVRAFRDWVEELG